jgi:hypothetical protein
MNILSVVSTVLDRVIPDKNARAKAQEALEAADKAGELQLLFGQQEINKAEAAHKSIFVAGWRPFVGWICGASLLYNFLLYPFLSFLTVVLMEKPPELPVLDSGQLMTLITGMLGLVASRSHDKLKGTHKE